jgi:hypothetical protein
MISRLLIVSVLLVGCETGPKPKVTPQSSELVSVSKLSRDGGKVTFRLRNISSQTIAYAHWFGMDAEPVAYCRSADGSIRPCGTKAVITPDNDFWTHEVYLKPGASIRFVAQPGDASAVGVLLWVDGKERYVWSASRP